MQFGTCRPRCLPVGCWGPGFRGKAGRGPSVRPECPRLHTSESLVQLHGPARQVSTGQGACPSEPTALPGHSTLSSPQPSRQCPTPGQGKGAPVCGSGCARGPRQHQAVCAGGLRLGALESRNPPGLRSRINTPRLKLPRPIPSPDVCRQVLSTYMWGTSRGLSEVPQERGRVCCANCPSKLPGQPSAASGPSRASPLMTAALEKALGPFWDSRRLGQGGLSVAQQSSPAPSPPDADPPEPSCVAGRSHPDILLSVPGYGRTHRLCKLQRAQVGWGSGRFPSRQAPAPSSHSACLYWDSLPGSGSGLG